MSLFEEAAGATPLAPEDRVGLIQTSISFRNELNQAERENIEAGIAWAARQRRRDLLTDEFVRLLHRRMFGRVWRWAGAYRTTERNLGIAPYRIAPEIRLVLDDARYWIERTTFSSEEISVRLHHRLVQIHPFANGNGRHTRLLADLMAQRLGLQPFTWGRGDLAAEGEVRRRYIAALQAADNHDMAPLLTFARS